MSTRLMFGRAIPLLATIAFLLLPGQQAVAHKAHQQKKEAVSVPEVTGSRPVQESTPVQAPVVEPVIGPSIEPASPPTSEGSADPPVAEVLADAPAAEPSADLPVAEVLADAPAAEPSASPPIAEASVVTPISLVEWLGRLHPLLVHFPIALLICALLAEILFAATGELLFRHALRFTLWGGVLAAIPTVALGWIFAATGPTEQGWLLEYHRWAGTAAASMAILTLAINERGERAEHSRLPLRICLALVATLIGVTGFLGGSLVYGIEHLLWYTQ